MIDVHLRVGCPARIGQADHLSPNGKDWQCAGPTLCAGP